MEKRKKLGYCPDCGKMIYYRKEKGGAVTVEGHEDCEHKLMSDYRSEKELRSDYFVFFKAICEHYYHDSIPEGVRLQKQRNDLIDCGKMFCIAVLLWAVVVVVAKCLGA